MRRLLTASVIGLSLLVVRADAQSASVNAALRYWMAFALMRDPPDGKAGVSNELIDRVASGAAPWDDSKFGSIVDQNREALSIMRRATSLPSCDWALEYDLGPNTPIAHLAKARVLGRLNALDAARLAARGQLGQAVDAWLAGVRFSQHVAHDGTLISLLSARLSLSPALTSLSRASAQPSLDATHRQQILATVRAIPEAGFDWADAMRREAEVLAIAKRRDPTLNAPMPSRAKVDETGAEVRGERRALLDALAAR